MPLLLDVKNLQTEFILEDRGLRVVDGVSFSIDDGEVLGLVGESGSGKTMTALSVMRLHQPPARIVGGEALFRGPDGPVDLTKQTDTGLQNLLGSRIAMIFQDPMASLNPVLSVGYQIAETLRVHGRLSKAKAGAAAIELLEKVGIAGDRANDYPHEFSGGMRQRVMIAMAIGSRPKLLIADEPTTALDVTTQGQILTLLQEIQRDASMAILIISHDLHVISRIADRVAVMYAGKIVESASVEDLFARPQHPYTQALVAAIPAIGFAGRRLPTIEGAPPRLRENHPGCSFYPRCPVRLEKCAGAKPVMTEVSPRSFASCFVKTALVGH